MRLQADRDRCTGSGNCAQVAPSVFDQDDEGLVVLVEPEPGPEHEDDVREAIVVCPVQALRDITEPKENP
ncbi:ferredoxin [Micromonospora eburnea]|uniref:Ferredoxin n=2 Tax=Micromonospora eburnea TaxID=227316 RepID=A0A1C6UJ91_9ACTN|nr:ferredoxin [Micromonospora eburnea]